LPSFGNVEFFFKKKIQSHNRCKHIIQALAEKVKAEKLLEELEKASQPSIAETKESISEEERYMLRKVGLQMKPFLLLGDYSSQPSCTLRTSVLSTLFYMSLMKDTCNIFLQVS
jgi:predicted Holliday junction resolvase-like endonuclease